MKKILLLGLLILAGIQSYCGVKSEIEKKKYVFENDTISQKIEIQIIDESRIVFTLQVVNKKRNITKIISDTAQVIIDELRSSAAENIDFDFDEKVQLPYKVKTYFLGKKCEYFRIDVDYDKKDRVYIFVSDQCPLLYDKFAPFWSLGTLRELK